VPVIRADRKEETKPDWVPFTAYGISSYPVGPVDMDLHYHDCHEYYFVVEGRAIVESEGQKYEVGPGDVVCTHMGDEHRLLEVVEPMTWLWLEGELQGQKRRGHLHR